VIRKFFHLELEACSQGCNTEIHIEQLRKLWLMALHGAVSKLFEEKFFLNVYST
jgi:hypothetical protein